MKTKKNGAIELLRIIAASCIVLHYHQQGTKIDFLPIAFYGGSFEFGKIVEMFFLISGLFAYKHVQSISRDSRLIDFGKRKIIRLYPMLIITVLAELFLRTISTKISGGQNQIGLFDLLVNLLGLQTWNLFDIKVINNPVWSLSVLIYCYLIFFLFTKYSKRSGINPFHAYAAILVFAAAEFYFSWNTILVNTSIARGLFAFFLGIYLGKYLSTTKENKWEKAAYFLPFLFILLIACGIKWPRIWDQYLYIFMMWIPLLIFAVRCNPQILANNETILLLGQAAFNVYLWNEPLACLRGILEKTEGLHVHTVGFMIVFFFFNWLVGITSFIYLEKPINKWINRKQEIDRDISSEGITILRN